MGAVKTYNVDFTEMIVNEATNFITDHFYPIGSEPKKFGNNLGALFEHNKHRKEIKAHNISIELLLAIFRIDFFSDCCFIIL